MQITLRPSAHQGMSLSTCAFRVATGVISSSPSLMMRQKLWICQQVLEPEVQLTVLHHMELAHSQKAGTADGSAAAHAWVVEAAHIVATVLAGRRSDGGSSRQSGHIDQALSAVCGPFIGRCDTCTAAPVFQGVPQTRSLSPECRDCHPYGRKPLT